jgi:hypothetical protein
LPCFYAPPVKEQGLGFIGRGEYGCAAPGHRFGGGVEGVYGVGVCCADGAEQEVGGFVGV